MWLEMLVEKNPLFCYIVFVVLFPIFIRILQVHVNTPSTKKNQGEKKSEETENRQQVPCVSPISASNKFAFFFLFDVSNNLSHFFFLRRAGRVNPPFFVWFKEILQTIESFEQFPSTIFSEKAIER